MTSSMPAKLSVPQCLLRLSSSEALQRGSCTFHHWERHHSMVEVERDLRRLSCHPLPYHPNLKQGQPALHNAQDDVQTAFEDVQGWGDSATSLGSLCSAKSPLL